MELCGHSSIFCKFEFKYYLHFCDQSDGKSVTIESVFCVEFKAWSVSISKCNLWRFERMTSSSRHPLRQLPHHRWRQMPRNQRRYQPRQHPRHRWRHLPAWHTPSGRWQTAGYDEKMGISVTKSIRHQTQTPLTTPSEATGRRRIMTKMVVHQWPKPTVIDWISFCDHRHFVTE